MAPLPGPPTAPSGSGENATCGPRRIERDFGRSVRASGQRRDQLLLGDIGRRQQLSDEIRRRSWELTGRLRTSLARAGVETLDPDLVILDEFQRFRHLLSVEEGGESAELAQERSTTGNAKVLLLSATPYKPFTLAEESAAGDDHWQDFRRVLSFLCNDPS